MRDVIVIVSRAFTTLSDLEEHLGWDDLSSGREAPVYLPEVIFVVTPSSARKGLLHGEPGEWWGVFIANVGGEGLANFDMFGKSQSFRAAVETAVALSQKRVLER